MLEITMKKSSLIDSVDNQNAGPTMTFLSFFLFDARVCYRLTAVAVKARHTTSTYNTLLES